MKTEMTQPEPIAPVDDLRRIAEELAKEIAGDFHSPPTLSACFDEQPEIDWPELMNGVSARILAALQRVQQGPDTLPKLPKGWRLYTIDSSISNSSRCMLVRSGQSYINWFGLSEEERETTSLYVSDIGKTPREAVLNAIEKIPKPETAQANADQQKEKP